MTDQPELMQALLSRYSLRSYDPNPLDENTLDNIEKVVQTTEPLLSFNRMGFSLHRHLSSKERSFAMGMINPHIQPPHILITWITGGEHPYTDLGFRMEQAAVQLHSMGIGSCFIGTLGREQSLNNQYNLPPQTVTGAILAIGKPVVPNAGNKPKKRLVLEKIAFRNDFSTPMNNPGVLTPILEAARMAPSATNAQPWRLVWKEPYLFLFVTSKKLANILSSEYKKYCLYDGGICMANIAMALKAHNLTAHWDILDPSSPVLPEHPREFIPLGKIKIDL
jgi:nitroreductase